MRQNNNMQDFQNINGYNGLLNKGLLIIKKKLWIIFLFSSMAFIIGWYYKGLLPIKYSAKSIFYPDKEATLTGSPLELINGSTSAKGGALTILAKVLNSRLVTEQIASRPIDTSFHKPYKILADWIIEDNNRLAMPWQKKTDIKKMSKRERVKMAASMLRGDCFAILDESGFMSLINHAYSEDLALYENASIIDELITFNFNKKTFKAQNDLAYLTKRADSLKKLYEDIKYEYAEFDDANKFIIKKTVGIPKEDLGERKSVISQRYFKIIELQEQAFIRVQTDKPIVEVLDEPFIDSVTAPSKLASGIMYAIFVSIFLTMFFLRNFVIDIIKDEIAKATAKKQTEGLNNGVPDSVL